MKTSVLLCILLFSIGLHAQLPSRPGAWLFLIEETGQSHAQIAARLESLGIGRVFIKIADGSQNCNWFPDACDPKVPATYQDRGLEAWAWSYNYPNQPAAQAEALEIAFNAGYDGYVLDLEIEFDGLVGELEAIMQAFSQRRDQVAPQKPLWVTTWGNPADHAFRIDIVDRYADAHMPQTYIEHWGGIWLENPTFSIETGNCEYRQLGAVKPIHHIISVETQTLDAETITDFLAWAGPDASIWRIPGGAVSQNLWQTWEQTNLAPPQRPALCGNDCDNPPNSFNNLLPDWPDSRDLRQLVPYITPCSQSP